MASPAKNNFVIYQGSTFEEVIRWEDSTKVYKTISGITKSAPAVVTAVGHGVPEGWRIKINNVVGMKEINSSNYIENTVVLTADTLELNSVNAAGYTTYTSGGVLEYNAPIDLSGYTARMQIREKVDSTTVLLELTTENNKIILDNANKTITLLVSATDTAALTFTTGVYSLEMQDAQGKVTTISTGSITVKKEVTR